MDWKKLYDNNKIVNGLDGFQGDYEVFSNFHRLSTPIIIDLPFNSDNSKPYKFYDVECAFQASKTYDIDAIKQMVIFSKNNQQGKAKRFGRKVQLRTDWESIKIDVMRELLRTKLSVSNLFMLTLIKSYPKIIAETNYWGDTFWGVCNFVGKNNLGILLMELRSELLNF